MVRQKKRFHRDKRWFAAAVVQEREVKFNASTTALSRGDNIATNVGLFSTIHLWLMHVTSIAGISIVTGIGSFKAVLSSIGLR